MVLRPALLLAVTSFLTAGSLEIDDSLHHAINYLSIHDAPDAKTIQEKLDIESDEFITMRSAEDEVFVCQLPQEGEQKTEPTTIYQGPSPADLLSPLYKEKICSYRIDPYWSYELCHGRYLIQFHEDKQKKGARTEYYLGNYHQDYVSLGTKLEEQANPPKRMIGEEERPYYPVLYSQGTNCDITGKPRTTTVIYICDEDAKTQIYSFAETSSCTYEVVVLTNRLCKHPAYKPPAKKEQKISCYNMDEDADIAKPHALNAIDKAQEEVFKNEYIVRIIDGDEAKELLEMAVEKAIEEYQKQVKEEQLMRFAGERRAPRSLDDPFTHSQVLVDDTVNRILTGRECIVSGNGWWQYEFCYGKKLVQFHVEPNGDRTEIVLGEWDEAVHKVWVDEKPEFRGPKIFGNRVNQISHLYVKGDFCHESKAHRSVEIRLRCKKVEGSPLAVLMDIKEPSTCQYILILESERFCEPLQYADDYGLIALEPISDESMENEPENDKT